ncbi:MAG: hypothetical protein PWP27_2279 [Clostridiales bacterium]|jgi:hypothetical protein|nr:hypothetical protein [Clostridiales bacterium]MDK2934469.1 hypothetical protein [Clostridiales bacterium]
MDGCDKGVIIMKIIQTLDENEKRILINEFISTYDVTDRESIPIKLLTYLREQGLKIEDGNLFNEICDFIDTKYFK